MTSEVVKVLSLTEVGASLASAGALDAAESPALPEGRTMRRLAAVSLMLLAVSCSILDPGDPTEGQPESSSSGQPGDHP